MKATNAWVAVALAALVLGAAGCGGGSSAVTAAAKTPVITLTDLGAW